MSIIVTLNPIPPICSSIGSFDSKNLSAAKLYVPKDSYVKYYIDDVWGNFSNIEKIETLATSISLSKTSTSLEEGASETIEATIMPSNAPVLQCMWSSDNSSVATVDQSGKIIAVKAGIATIKARAIDGSDVTASCEVTVKVEDTKIAISQVEANLPVNEIMTLNCTIIPSNIAVEWSTSNANVAPIKNNGDGSITVVGLSDGIATITAQATNGSGASASCVVIVGVGGIEGVEFDDNAVEVARYDIHGRLLSEPIKGINIVKYSDGTVKKIVIN